MSDPQPDAGNKQTEPDDDTANSCSICGQNIGNWYDESYPTTCWLSACREKDRKPRKWEEAME